MWGSDQAASVEINGLFRLVANIRDIEQSLGDGVKRIYEGELAARKKLRRVASAEVSSNYAHVTSSFQLWRVLSPAVVVAGALVLIVLERRFPYDRRQKFFRAGFWDDLIGYTFIQSYLLGLLITQVSTWIDSATGLSRLHLVSAWPIWVQVAFFIITHDLYIYTFHRMQHRFGSLWRIHEAHHATVDVDWLSGSRSHALEIMVNQSIEFLPILLLGAAPEVWLIKDLHRRVVGDVHPLQRRRAQRLAAEDHQRPRDAPLAPRHRDPRRRELRDQVRVLGLDP